MSSLLAIQPKIQDRFTVMFLAALGLHAALILLVGFDFNLDDPREVKDSLDVVLVNWSTEEAPDDADFLAQANQEGGGDSEEVERPADEVTSQLPMPDPGDARENTQAGAPLPVDEQQEFVTSTAAERAQNDETTDPLADPLPLPTASQMMLEAQRMARMQPEERPEPNRQARKKTKFISASTKEYEYASYMNAWVAKVERIGNLNYPEEALHRNISGHLVLSVGIYPDGSVESINVMTSSGSALLDQAAVKIVRIAAPFAPLTDDITEQTDILNITRTWRFSQGVAGL